MYRRRRLPFLSFVVCLALPCIGEPQLPQKSSRLNRKSLPPFRGPVRVWLSASRCCTCSNVSWSTRAGCMPGWITHSSLEVACSPLARFRGVTSPPLTPKYFPRCLRFHTMSPVYVGRWRILYTVFSYHMPPPGLGTPR